MTREEQIKEAAIYNAGTCAMEDCWQFELGFIQGAEWADKNPVVPYTKVTDNPKSLPKEGEDVLLLFNDGSFSDGNYSTEFGEKHWNTHLYDDGWTPFEDVVGWYPLPKIEGND